MNNIELANTPSTPHTGGQGGYHIGVYGGSFNPIHTGHIALARHIMKTEKLDAIWFVVSPQNPFKAGSGSLINDNVRLGLAQKALEGEEGIIASDVEFHLPKPSYMWNTLQHLTALHPDAQFTLIIGADNWTAFDRWYHSGDILSHHHIIVYPRQGYSLSPADMPPGVKLVPMPLYPVSSTMIRDKIANGESISGLVPKSIEDDVRKIYATK